MAVIDTSASIGSAILERISQELERMSYTHEVLVVECDAAIHATYPYSCAIKSVKGRAGTDLRPPFNPTFLKKTHPDVIVYCTDGCGPAPQRPPSIPVIWCLTALGIRPTAWGHLVRMTDP